MKHIKEKKEGATMSLLNQLKGFIKPYEVFAEREKIRIGKRLENGRPVSLDYFILPPTLQAVYESETAKEIDVMLPNWPVEKIIDVKLKMYNKAGMRVCAGDGERAIRLDPNDNSYVEMECPYRECKFYQEGKCSERAILKLLCPKSPMLGIYQFDTGSFYSVNNLLSQMKLMVTLFGRYHDIPLLLGVKKVREQKHRYENKKLKTTTTIYPVVFFKFPYPLEEMIARYRVAMPISREEIIQNSVNVTTPDEIINDGVEIEIEQPVESSNTEIKDPGAEVVEEKETPIDEVDVEITKDSTKERLDKLEADFSAIIEKYKDDPEKIDDEIAKRIAQEPEKIQKAFVKAAEELIAKYKASNEETKPKKKRSRKKAKKDEPQQPLIPESKETETAAEAKDKAETESKQQQPEEQKPEEQKPEPTDNPVQSLKDEYLQLLETEGKEIMAANAYAYLKNRLTSISTEEDLKRWKITYDNTMKQMKKIKK